MKILYADSIDESRLQPLNDAGHDVVVDKSLSADDLPSAMAGVNVLVVRSTKVTAAAVRAADDLGLIVRAGAGTDNIDKAAASRRGVFVANVPGRNAIAVAELTLGLLLAIDRRIPDNVADLRAGTWAKTTYTAADGLYGKTIGIVGLGDIGLAVAHRARGFGLAVAAVDKPGRSSAVTAKIESLGIRLVDSLTELAANSDILSIHVPKAAGTAGLIDAEVLAAMPGQAIVLNTSRADVIDHDALLAELNAGRLRAGLDVWPDEPSTGQGPFRSRLATHPRVVGTHHIGASTAQAQRAVADGTVQAIEAYVNGDPVNCVNLKVEPSGSCTLSIRHRDEVGVLAQVFAVLRAGGLNVQQMQNRLFDGGDAAVADINVGRNPTDDTLEKLAAIEQVIRVTVLRQEAADQQ
jgi:D-3-phosphoglycerate dehydrogenase